MREFINIIETVLAEGGNVFKNPDKTPATQRINKADVDGTVKFLEKIVDFDFSKKKNKETGLPLAYLGSTGQAATSGDIDLAIDSKSMSKADLVAKLVSWLELNKLDPAQYLKVGAEVHFKTAINGNPKNGFVQTDFNVYDTDKFDWSVFYNSQKAGSQYKGRHRAVLLSSIAKALNLKLGGNGLFDRATNELVTADPDKAAAILLGKGHNRQDLGNVETIYTSLKSDPNKDAKLKDFREFIATEKLPEPQTVQEDGEAPGAAVQPAQAAQPAKLAPLSKQELINILKAQGYTDIKIKGNILKVLVQLPEKNKTIFRKGILADILTNLKRNLHEYGPKESHESKFGSIGGVAFDKSPLGVAVKDVGKQEEKSAGVANEKQLASILQSVIEKYKSVNIVFKDTRGNTLSIENANKVEETGKKTKDRRKADVEIFSPEKKLPVSLKQLDAEFWESADKLYGQKAKEIVEKLVDEGVVTLSLIQKPGVTPYYQLNKEIVIEPTEEESMKTIFGSDINPAGGIIIQTFKPEHFSQVNNNVTVDAHAIIKSKEDIPESHLMYWLIRNNATRSMGGIRGLRIMAVTGQRAFGHRGDKPVVVVDGGGNVLSTTGRVKKNPEDEKMATPISMKPSTDVGGVGREKRK